MTALLIAWFSLSAAFGVLLAVLGGIRNGWADPTTPEEDAEQMAALAETRGRHLVNDPVLLTREAL